MRLKGLVALVMGAGSSGPGWGNGKATAFRFAEEGATVISADYNRAAAEETAHLIAEAGGKAEAHACDATKSYQIEALVADIAAAMAGSTCSTTMSASPRWATWWPCRKQNGIASSR